MTLDQAIKKFEGLAHKEEARSCSKEHRELADWLIELRELRGHNVVRMKMNRDADGRAVFVCRHPDPKSKPLEY